MMPRRNDEWSVSCGCPGGPLKRGGREDEKSQRVREENSRKKKQKGKSMTGNLGICRTEIGSHLNRLSKRKADFTADGSLWQVCRPQGLCLA